MTQALKLQYASDYPLNWRKIQTQALNQYLAHIDTELGQAAGETQYQPAVENMKTVIENDGVVRMYVQQMLDQSLGKTRYDVDAQKKKGSITTITRLLDAVNYIITRAPEFVYNSQDPGLTSAFTFPLSSLFTEMMATDAGEAAFRNAAFNDAITQVLQAWCDYLDSEASTSVLNEGPNGWLSPEGQAYTELQNFETKPDQPHLGFASYNAFFHRKIKSKLRPIALKDDPKAIVSPNDGTIYQTAANVQRETKFWAKGQTYSLQNILNNDLGFTQKFEGGTIIQTFLSGNDYHRFHAPVTGKVVKIERVSGLTFSQRNSERDESAGTESMGYEAAVNTRMLIYIEAEEKSLGTVCVIPIGITEISSVRTNSGIKEGSKVTKGQELGYFSYGGSTLCTLFEKGVIKQFVTQPNTDKFQEQGGAKVQVNSLIALAN